MYNDKWKSAALIQKMVPPLGWWNSLTSKHVCSSTNENMVTELPGWSLTYPLKKHHPQREVIFKKEHVSEVNGFIRISRQGYILVLASSPKQLNTKDPASPAFKRRVSVWLLLIYKALLPYYQKRSETWMIHMVYLAGEDRSASLESSVGNRIYYYLLICWGLPKPWFRVGK